ncbi:MAG: hypothetical protein LBP34_07910 [Flavobacteriaceae bacterium]|jgi:hypothetical protein|nr:hypothetical protein [Flavobacteriaceae bacterium]
MISSAIHKLFPNHKYASIAKQTIYIVDYTEKEKELLPEKEKKGVEICSTKPKNIKCFCLSNPDSLSVEYAIFDKNSFPTYSTGEARSHCECIIFPSRTTKEDSWVLFLELKYPQSQEKNGRHLKKAVYQLYRTQYYYFSTGSYSRITKYLIASIPSQDAPFLIPKRNPFFHFHLTPEKLKKLKEKRNIIIRFQNSAIIEDETKINVGD